MAIEVERLPVHGPRWRAAGGGPAVCGPSPARLTAALPMHWYWSSSGLAIAATAPLFAAMAGYAWRQQRASAARSLALVLFAGTWWTLAYALELSGGDPPTIRLWGDLKYLGILLLPPAWTVFVLQYTDRRRWLRLRWLAPLIVMPTLTLATLANAETHDLIRYYPPFVPGSGTPSATVGPLFWVIAIYSYSVLGAGVLLLVRGCLPAPRVYRRQGFAVAAAWAAGLAANLLHVLQVGPFRLLDATPFALLAIGFVLLWGVLRHGLLPIVPIARDVVIERMSDGVIVLDAYQRIVDVNPAGRQVLGLRRHEGSGVPAEVLLPRLPPLVAVEADGDAHPAEIQLGPSGSERHYDIAASPLRDSDGRASGHVLVLRDITERKSAEERLAQLALSDQLTGVANRKMLHERLTQLIRAGQAFTVLFCDLDRFKRINDRLGHDVGDLVLVELARRFGALVGPGGVVARLGGDEFVLIDGGTDHPAEALATARRVTAAVALPIAAAAHELYLTVSVGVCRSPDQGTDPGRLIRQADQAMYRAKARGGNRVELHAHTVEDSRPEWLSLERDLHGFGQRDELELWYQPITSLGDDTCLGMEALLRWRHPAHGLLPPDLFIPVAEQADLMHALGRWVLDKACDQAVQWGPLMRSERPLSVSVNVSARQCDGELVGDVGMALQRSGLDPAALTLEITETVVLQPGDETLHILHDVSSLGVGIATDDFGTGYTSLEQLRRYPLDVLKIDRSFVNGITGRAEDETIVGAMISLAHDLGLRVVAEGVETSAQRELLRRLGCDAAQGFLYSPPLPLPGATAFLAAITP